MVVPEREGEARASWATTDHPAAAGATVGVVIGSTRPTRICPDIARWTQQELGCCSALDYDLIDLAEVRLPMLDEPVRAALRDYRHEHTKAWSRRIEACAGFVVVLPQYNWGYPAVLKNALDYLYEEWNDKPVTSITYGTRGGVRAANQMHEVFRGLHMRPLETRVEVSIAEHHYDDVWQLRDIETTMRPYRGALARVDAEMTEALSQARQRAHLETRR